MEKKTLDLDGHWEFMEYPAAARRMRDLEEGRWMPAQIPSSIYLNLVEAGCFERFSLEANPEDFDWVSQRDWIYRKHVELTDEFRACDEIDLVFEGLDTVTQLWVNEKLIGKTDNMFIPHRFSIADRIHTGRNAVMVKFLSATAYADRLLRRYGAMSEHHYGDPRRSYLRKAQYQFGSVLGPALPGCGIYRPVRLEAWNTARIDSVHIRTIDCNEHYADVRVAVAVQRTAARQAGTLEGKMTVRGAGVNLEQTLRFEPDENVNTAILRLERLFSGSRSAMGCSICIIWRFPSAMLTTNFWIAAGMISAFARFGSFAAKMLRTAVFGLRSTTGPSISKAPAGCRCRCFPAHIRRRITLGF